MTIGIDASRAFVDEKTGTEVYSYQIITHILQLPEARNHKWILYTKFPILQDKFPSNIEVSVLKLPYLWTQFGLALKTWTDHLDVLWVPAHTLPLLRRGFAGLGSTLRTIVTIHGLEYEFLPEYKNGLQKWYLPLSTWYAVKTASRIIAVSQFTKNQLIQRLQAGESKITVIHEGVNLRQRVKGSDDSGVLKKYHLQKNGYLLFIGTIQPRKNLARLIASFNALDQKDLKLVLAGKWGWDYQDVLDAIETSPKKGDIVTTGYIDQAERDSLLAYAAVYVQPSITEGFGLPVLEAFAAEIPVVSSNGGALTEVVGNAALVFDPSSVSDMTKCLNRLLSDPKLVNKLRQKGKSRLPKFSWDLATLKTYNMLIQS